MEVTKKALEATGTIDAKSQLVLNESLPAVDPTNVCVIILLEETDIDEMEWLKAAAANPAFEISHPWEAETPAERLSNGSAKSNVRLRLSAGASLSRSLLDYP